MEENSDRAFGDGVDALAEAEGITISLTVLPPRVDPRHQVRFRSLFNIVVTEQGGYRRKVGYSQQRWCHIHQRSDENCELEV
ncbi:hypothetical protein V6N11_033664 [Hibiscus sabdariffa]|uniref:Uncharacterized protein n=1 Tax=Hibiscus sabdariffa TaxID=183260 RepID=A0ABR2PZ93_9ROSI